MTLTRLRGGGHYIIEERPDEVTAALLDLLGSSRVSSGPQGADAG